MSRLSTAAAIAWLLTGASLCAAAPATVRVRTAAAHKQRLSQTITGYGEVAPDPQAQTTRDATYAAFIQRLDVTLGQPVKKGDPIMTLRTAPAARAQYLSAQAQWQNAKRQLAHKRKLRAQQLATNADVDAARQALATAKANFAAQQALGAGQRTRTLKAPFTGIVAQLPVAPGNQVQPGAPLFQLAQRKALQVALGVEPDEAGRIEKGMPVQVTPLFAGGAGVETDVWQVNAVVDPGTRLVNIIVRLRGQQAAAFLPGMRVRGSVTVRTQNALTVPRSAVLQDAKGSYIFVVRQGKAQRVNVRTGLEQDGRIGIKGALPPGASVVVEGNYELADGMAVRAAP